MTPNEILGGILTQFDAAIAMDGGIKSARIKLANMDLTYADVLALADKSGSTLGDIIANAILSEYAGRTIPEADALAIIPPALRKNHEFVSQYIMRLTIAQNRRAGLPPTSPELEFDSERADGIAVNLARQGVIQSGADLKPTADAIATNSMIELDDVTSSAAEIQYEMGIPPTVVRRAESGCCEWCDRLAGEYEYSPNMDRDVFRRHNNCRCEITYIPGKRAKRHIESDAAPKRIRERIRTEQEILSGRRL